MPVRRSSARHFAIFFLAKDGVYFSELSPRPHDTGMVTLALTQNLSEFELHARAVLGLPIPEITLEHAGASAVILAPDESPKIRKFPFWKWTARGTKRSRE